MTKSESGTAADSDEASQPCLAHELTSFCDDVTTDGDDVTPPDGGYGWLVVVCAFCIATIIAIGGMYGVFYIELLEYFGETNGITAWPASLNIGFGLGAGPLASIVSNRIGHRLTCMLGSVLCALGFLVCAFSDNIYYWYAGYGALCGVGYSFQFVTLTVMVGSYFSSKRNLATGLAVSGIGVGIMLNSPLVDACIQLYTWRGAALILSGISLQACVFAAFLRPLPGITDKKDEEEQCLPDASLLSEWRLILFALCELLWNIGAAIYASLLPDFAYVRGVSTSVAGMLVSYMGFGSLLGRLALAFCTNCKFCKPIYMYIAATLVNGLTVFATIGSVDYIVFVMCSAVYGMGFGLQATLAPLMTIDLFGLDRMTSAYGYLLLGDGIGCVIGPPFAGFMYDATSSYTIPWLTCGGLTCLGAAVMIPLALKPNKRQRNVTDDVMIMETPNGVTMRGLNGNNSNSNNNNNSAIVVRREESVDDDLHSTTSNDEDMTSGSGSAGDVASVDEELVLQSVRSG